MRRLSVVGLVCCLFAEGCDQQPRVDAGARDGSVALDAGAVDAGPGGVIVPERYEFTSRFEPGVSSIDHRGQTVRHLLIQDLKSYIGGLTDDVDSARLDPAETVVVANLEYFFSLGGSERADDPIRLRTDPAAEQRTYGAVSGADLLAKLAGNDAVTDHLDWSTEFRGWSEPEIAAHGGGTSTPTELVRAMFETIEANAIARGTGASRMSPVDSPRPLPVHVTESGLDLQQLVAKFLLGAVTFSQAADDYMDDDVEGKGLRSDNVDALEGHPWTALERSWDEAFGYFGAAVYYGDRTAEELAEGPRYVDSDGSGGISFLTEYSFGASVNLAKRDRGATAAPTDFMGAAWSAFRRGRAMITAARGPLSPRQMTALATQRDQAINAWESAIAATVVHYINNNLQIMQDFDTAAYDHERFLAHAKAWSEMKGFALMFQFNPRSPLSRADFVQLHSLLGDAPTLPAEGATAGDAYRAALREARALLATTYGFDAANVGDDAGTGGW